LAVRVRRVEGAPVVAVRLWVAGGARVEDIPGQALVTGRMLNEGTRQRDWRQIADDAEARGMNLSSLGNFEGHGVSVDALAQDWELALDWAAEMLLASTFPAERCQWMARQAAAELESLADEPDTKTAWAFLEQLYTPHPRRRPLQGDAESLRRLAAADCVRFHQDAMRHGVVVAVAGLVDEEAVERRLRSLLAGLEKASAPSPEPASPAGLAERRREIFVDAKDQANLFVGQLTLPRRHPDHAALEVLAVVLGSGAGLTGRIPARIREREGLAYTAHAQTVAGAGIDPGRLYAYVGTAPDTVERAESGVKEEITRLVESGVEEQELSEARAYLLGREPFQRETARQWADLLLDAEHYGLPVDDPHFRRAELLACTRSTVEAAARRHIHPDSLYTTVGLPRPAAKSKKKAEKERGKKKQKT
jgi:zinc protease